MQRGDVIAERYRLEAQIGEGGMAAVWRATDARLDRPVAIKFLFLRAQSDPNINREAVAAFQREAKIAAAIRHRNVVEVLDFGSLADDVPFMVMEVLEGYSLGKLLDEQQTFSVEESLRIVGLTLNGLMAVHDAGIVHRDLKPENIFLLQERGAYYPKLVDFGISKSLDAGVGPSAVKTQEGLFVGTPQYMSPEQARGIPDIDRRTDIYSLGVIMYELLSGGPPYEAEHIGDLMMLIMKGEAPPLIEVVPQVGQGLSDVVRRAMCVDREQRFADANQMSDALMSATQAGTGRATPLSLPPPSGARGGATVAGIGPAMAGVAGGAPVGAGATGGTAAQPLERDPPSSGGRGVRGLWLAAAAVVLLGGAGVGFGLFAARTAPAPAASRYIVVETPSKPATTPAALPAALPAAPAAPASPTLGQGTAGAAGALVDQAAQPAVAARAEPPRAEAPSAPRARKAAKAPASKAPASKAPRASTPAARLSQDFTAQQGRIAPCFSGRLEAARGLPQVTIRFKINKRGKVLSTRVSPVDFRKTTLGQCIERKARDMRFEAQAAPIAFNIPLKARIGG